MSNPCITEQALEVKINELANLVEAETKNLKKWIERDSQLCVDFNYPDNNTFIEVGKFANNLTEITRNFNKGENIFEVIAKNIQLETTTLGAKFRPLTTEDIKEYHLRTGLLKDYILYAILGKVLFNLKHKNVYEGRISQKEIEELHNLFEHAKASVYTLKTIKNIESPDLYTNSKYLMLLSEHICYLEDTQDTEAIKALIS